MVFKFAYSLEFTKGYQPAELQWCRLSWSSFTEGLWRHFIFLGFEISIFCETGYKLSTCQVSNPPVIWIKFYKGFKKKPSKQLWRHYDVTSQYLVFKIAHSVGPNRRHQPAKFHLPRLSASNFTRAGGKHPLRLTCSQKPSPYRVKQYNLSQAAMKIRHVLFILNEINKWNVKLS